MDGIWKHVKKMKTNVHAPQEKPASVQKKCSSWAYSWTWRHNVALLESVAAALPKALEHWSFDKRKKWMGGCLPGMIENDNFLMFFVFNPWRAKSIHRAGETQILTLESHACQSKWMSTLQTFFDKSHKYKHFVSQPRKSEFQIHHLYKGGESNGCSFSVWIVCWGCCGWLDCWLDWFITKKQCWMFQPCILCHLLLSLLGGKSLSGFWGLVGCWIFWDWGWGATSQHWHLFFIQTLVWRCFDRFDLMKASVRSLGIGRVLTIFFDSISKKCLGLTV